MRTPDSFVSLVVVLVSLFAFAACSDDNLQPSITEADEPDVSRFVNQLAEEADAGNAEAGVRLIVLEQWIAGGYEQALPDLIAYAEGGNASAAELVASAYMHGLGVDVNYEEAASWLRLAVENGSETAARSLATYEQSLEAD